MGRLFEQRSLAKDKDEDILNEIIRFSIVPQDSSRDIPNDHRITTKEDR
jgi:hypothetical protein